MSTLRILFISISLLAAAAVTMPTTAGPVDAPLEGPLRVSSSELLLPSEPEGEFGNRWKTFVDARPDGGFCTAWFDYRQGGILMAARIAATGQLLDPMGIPVSFGGSGEPRAVMATDTGCMVVHRASRGSSSADVAGTFIPWNDPSPEERFRIEGADHNPLYTSSSTELLMVSLVFRQGMIVRRISADGTVHLRVLPPHTPLALTTVGDRTFLLTRESARRTTLWEIDEKSELVRIADYDVEGFPHRMYPRDDAVLIVSGENHGLLRAITIGTDGTVRSEAELALDWTGTSTVGLTRIEGLDRLFISQYSYERSEFRSLALDPDTLSVVQTFPFPLYTVGQSRSSAIYLYHASSRPTSENRLRYELAGSFPSGTGMPLTNMPYPEVIADTASEGNRVAVLHAEFSGRYDATLYVSLPASSRPELLEPIEVGPVNSHRSAAVALRDEITIVAWVDGAALWYRRLGPDHLWIDSSPQLLSPGPAGIGSDALISTEEGFLIVWGELEERSLRMAAISLAGERTDRTLPYEAPANQNSAQTPLPTAVERWNNGYIVAGRDVTPPQCRICTCPPPTYEVFALRFDDDWNLVASLLDDLGGYNYTRNDVGLVTADDSVLITSTWRGYLVEPDDDGSFETRVIEMPLESATGLWYGDAYLLVGRWDDESTLDVYGDRRESTAAVVFRPQVDAVTAYPLVDDFTAREILSYQPRLLSAGDRLYVVGSEVSTDGTEGTVRRLRLHLLEEGPPPERRRAVRR